MDDLILLQLLYGTNKYKHIFGVYIEDRQILNELTKHYN